MFLRYRTEALVISKREQGEADRLFTLFSRKFGKIVVLGRGIRKIASKLRGGILLFSHSEIEFVQGKIYKTLTDALAVEYFSSLRNSIEKLSLAQRISEDLLDFLVEQKEDEKLWFFLLDCFRQLDTFSFSQEKLQLFYFYFFWNFVSLLGYRPDLYHCFSCQRELEPKSIYFSPQEGVFLCAQCFSKRKIGFPLGENSLKLLRLVLERDWSFLSRLRVTERETKELEKLSQSFAQRLKI